MKMKQSSLIFFLLLFSCRQPNNENIALAEKVNKNNGISNLCIIADSYLTDTLTLTHWDSLDKQKYPVLIFKNDNKLSSIVPDIFQGSKIGIDINSYWKLNFGNSAFPASPDGNAFTNANPPSRYDIYRYEIATSGMLNMSSPTGGTTGNGLNENGLPNCAAASNVSGVDTSTGGVDRRIIYGAVMNCNANNLQPGSNGTYYSLAFAKFFMVRPVASAGNGSGAPAGTLWTELVSLVYPGDGTGVARDRVQLYR